MAGDWVVFLMGEAQLRRVYAQLLDRRGYHVRCTQELDEVCQLIDSNCVELAIIDESLNNPQLESHLQDWSADPETPPIVLLTAPGTAPTAGTQSLRTHIPTGIDLVLQKPISPIEFGIQIDELVADSSPSSLHDDSIAEREFDAIRREFLFQLDEELHYLDQLWQHVFDAHDAPQKAAMRLHRALAPLRASSRQLGFVDFADDLEALESFIEPFLHPDAQVNTADLRRGESLVSTLHDACRSLQTDHPSVNPLTYANGHRHTILVIDPDDDYRQTIENFGEQFMVRIRTASTLKAAISRVQTPMLTGVLLSTNATPDDTSLRKAIDRLRRVSPLTPLPVALIGEDSEELDRVRSLWAGASALVSKPITAPIFSRIAGQLAALRRAQKSSILVLEPDEDFAQFLDTHLNTRHMAVHHCDRPHDLFEKMEEYRPDLLILSTHLTGLSAFDICRTLRAVPRWRAVPTIMVSRKGCADTRLAAYQAGADDVIGRDIDVDELRARIRVRLEHIRLLRQRADRDALTGLLTRRAFLEQLAARLSEARRHDRRLTFVLLDVDRFKQVNDQYGHPAGDRVLKRLGQVLRDSFRTEDLRARWGGEEFAVVLINETSQTTEQALDRIREEFSEIRFKGARDTRFSVTFSAGIADYPIDGRDAESLLSAADARLLRAKQTGRNTIIAKPT